MNINIHIERLVLDGLPVAGPDSSIVQVAIETELARALAGQGLSRLSSGAVPRVSGRPNRIDARRQTSAHRTSNRTRIVQHA